MNPIWRVTMEMSKSRSENQKLNKKRREMLRDKTRKEKEKRRMEALERDRQRFIVGQEQNHDDLEKEEDLEELQESAAEKFQKELCWCIQQTQVGLANIKPSSKEAKPLAEEAHKLLRILTSPKAPMAKKRQVMRATFGDYRSKMQQEERKHKADMSKRMCLEAVSPSKQGNSTFYRMSSSATAVPSSQILSTSSDLPGEAGSSGLDPGPSHHVPGSAGHDLGSVDKDRLKGGEIDTSMQELEQSTENMHILNPVQNETQCMTRGNDNASQGDKLEQIAYSEESEKKHSDQDEDLRASEKSSVKTGMRSDLHLNLSNENQPFSFNFDISERDLDRGNSRMRGSNKNLDGSLSENSTPEKGPGSGRKKSGSRKRNRSKKKQQAVLRDKEATVADNQKLQLEADGEFKFNFPDPVERPVTP